VRLPRSADRPEVSLRQLSPVDLQPPDYLATWLEGKKRSRKPDTWSSYEEAVRLYFVPAFGHLRMCDLRDHHISDLVTAMGQINRHLPTGKSHQNSCAD
jgi:hypothetical protein